MGVGLGRTPFQTNRSYQKKMIRRHQVAAGRCVQTARAGLVINIVPISMFASRYLTVGRVCYYSRITISSFRFSGAMPAYLDSAPFPPFASVLHNLPLRCHKRSR